MENNRYIPCQHCRQRLKDWNWYVCNECSFRVCPGCLQRHSGPYGNGGFKCSQCDFGRLHQERN